MIRVPAADGSVDLSIQGYCDQPQSPSLALSRQVLFFDIDPLDDAPRDILPSFTVVLNASVHAEALVIPHPHPDTRCLSLTNQVDIESALFSDESESTQQTDEYDSPTTDETRQPSDRIEPLAKELRKRFDDERKLIRQLTMDCRTPLLDELRECNHDVKCSGKAICHHLRDAVMNLVADLRLSLQQSPLVSDERQWQAVVADEKSLNYGAVSSESSESASTSSMDKKNIIILALEILAGVLGLGGLLACIRRHCRSPRRRTERLADREEKRRAREYRRLARRESLRKKWVAFRAVFRLPCKKLSCEEKQALVMDAAAFAVGEDVTIEDVEQAWDSAFSREYLSQQPGPSRLYKHEDGRSRSDSLPSYESEKLPDYASQPDGDIVIVNGYRVASPSLTGCSTDSAVTPDSSVPDLSPRCSHETLRTFTSRE